MLKLSKIYNLLNRNAKLTLTDPKHKEVYFYGKVKDIPDVYDSWIVNDIIEFSNYDLTIEVIMQKQ